MATAPTLPPPVRPKPVAVPALEAKLGKGPGKIGVLAFVAVLIVGVVYAGYSLSSDLTGVHNTSILPYVLLGIALLVALGFEFVNGVSRHRQRGGHRDLHPLAGAARRGGVVGLLEFSWRTHFVGSRRLRNHFAVARRADSASGQQSRFRDGLLPYWSQPSSGTSAPGISACLHPVLTL